MSTDIIDPKTGRPHQDEQEWIKVSFRENGFDFPVHSKDPEKLKQACMMQPADPKTRLPVGSPVFGYNPLVGFLCFELGEGMADIHERFDGVFEEVAGSKDELESQIAQLSKDLESQIAQLSKDLKDANYAINELRKEIESLKNA